MHLFLFPFRVLSFLRISLIFPTPQKIILSKIAGRAVKLGRQHFEVKLRITLPQSEMAWKGMRDRRGRERSG